MRDSILNEIVTSKIVEKISSRYWSYLKGNKEDFVQFIYLTLCELPEDKLQQLYDSQQLNFYIISIIRNQAVCDYNSFHKLYDDPRIEYVENSQIERDPDEGFETL